MAHPTTETLISYIENQLPKAACSVVDKHLSRPCLRCSQKIARLRKVLEAATHDRTIAPPAAVLRRAVALQQKRSIVSTQARSRVPAKLLFDSRFQLSPMITRGIPRPRQLLFKTQQMDIDLRVTADEGGNKLVGQILGSEQANEQSQAFVSLKKENGELLKGTETDSRGQFTFRQIPPGIYDLLFDLESQEVAITSIDFNNDY